MLFTLHIYQYRMEKSGKGGSQYRYITAYSVLDREVARWVTFNACEDYNSGHLHLLTINAILSHHWNFLVARLVPVCQPVCSMTHDVSVGILHIQNTSNSHMSSLV